jgi:hypothetical protein
MKKRIFVLLSALVLSASVALAATPTAPVFSMTVKSTKVANGANWSNDGGRELAVDGNNIYAAFHGPYGEPSVIRSTDGGATWGMPAVLANDPAGNASYNMRIAVAKDPLYTGKKIVCVTWVTMDGSLMYSYFVDRPTGTTWSTPVVIANTWETVNLAAAPNGSLHLLFIDSSTGLNYYATATNAEAPFSTPKQVPWSESNQSLAIDSNNNLYVTETHYDSVLGNTLYYHNKPASSSSWSSVVVAKTDTTNEINDNVSIAVYDANNIYIAFKKYPLTVANSENHVWLASSSNAGKTWTQKIVTPNATVYGTHPSITVNSSKVVTIAAHYVNYGPDGRITINKTSDNGTTWSANVSVIGNNQASTALDSAGKVCVLSNLDDIIDTFRNGSLGNPASLYFSREK